MLVGTHKVDISNVVFYFGRGLIEKKKELKSVLYANGITVILVDAFSLD